MNLDIMLRGEGGIYMSQYYLHTYHHKAVEVLTPSGSVAKGALHGRQFNIALASCKSASLLEGNNDN